MEGEHSGSSLHVSALSASSFIRALIRTENCAALVEMSTLMLVPSLDCPGGPETMLLFFEIESCYGYLTFFSSLEVMSKNPHYSLVQETPMRQWSGKFSF
jgi:hypothetical protein